MDQSDQFSLIAAREAIKQAIQATYGLTLFQNVLNDATAQAVLHLLNVLAAQEQDAFIVANAYNRAFHTLATEANTGALPNLPDAWQAYLLARILQDSNPWSLKVERDGVHTISPTLRAQAQRELPLLQHLFNLNTQELLALTRAAVTAALPILADAWMPWLDLTTTSTSPARDLMA